MINEIQNAYEKSMLSLAQCSQMTYAGFWMRFFAFIIDYAIFMIIVGGIFLMFIPAIDSNSITPIIPLSIVCISWILYWALLESSVKQATIGKMALGIIVTDLDGNKIKFGRAIGRNLAKLLSGIILFIGYVMTGFTKKKQALHDLIADTLVIRTPSATRKRLFINATVITMTILTLTSSIAYYNYKAEIEAQRKEEERQAELKFQEELRQQEIARLAEAKNWSVITIPSLSNLTVSLRTSWRDGVMYYVFTALSYNSISNSYLINNSVNPYSHFKISMVDRNGFTLLEIEIPITSMTRMVDDAEVVKGFIISKNIYCALESYKNFYNWNLAHNLVR